ncbi:MAG TPA: hypothetical protein VK094_06450 [Pseudogracilibacillus sp.]|nr:hypothetical protein [Pseudogracilibacillus sp.]
MNYIVKLEALSIPYSLVFSLYALGFISVIINFLAKKRVFGLIAVVTIVLATWIVISKFLTGM